MTALLGLLAPAIQPRGKVLKEGPGVPGPSKPCRDSGPTKKGTPLTGTREGLCPDLEKSHWKFFTIDSLLIPLSTKQSKNRLTCFEHRTSFPCQKTKGQWVRFPQRSQTRHGAVLGERQESPSSPSPCHSLGIVPGAEVEAQKGPLLGL